MKMETFLSKITDGKRAIRQSNTSDLFVEINAQNRLALQQTLLDMYDDIRRICDRNHLTVFLAGGSALGAVRHQGFIPWDDDLDLAMTRRDFRKFQRIFEKELGEKYFLLAPNGDLPAKSRFPKIVKKDTLFREITDASEEQFCGVFLDIFILDHIPENRLLQKWKEFRCNLLEFIAGQVLVYEVNTPEIRELYSRVGRWNYYLRRGLGFLFSFRRTETWYDCIDRAVQYQGKTSLCGLPTGSKHYLGEVFQKSDIFPVRYLPFEGRKAAVFFKVEKYLENLYGDYMTIPDEADRARHYVKEMRL